MTISWRKGPEDDDWARFEGRERSSPGSIGSLTRYLESRLEWERSGAHGAASASAESLAREIERSRAVAAALLEAGEASFAEDEASLGGLLGGALAQPASWGRPGLVAKPPVQATESLESPHHERENARREG
jgi:hypothetical protein